MPNGNHQWWFVLQDDEVVLCDLETKWNLMQVQTPWRLECFYKLSLLSMKQAGNVNSSSENKPMIHSVI